MKNTFRIFLTLFCSFIWTYCLTAEDKIAVIDMQKVFSGYEKTKFIEDQLNKQLAVYREYAEKLHKEYLACKKDFETLRDEYLNVSLSEAERENRKMRALEKGEELKRREVELAEYNKSRQKQLKDNFDRQKSDVLKEIKQVIANKAAVEGWTLILDKSGATLNDLPLVLYNAPNIEITQAVLQELNRVYRTGKNTAVATPSSSNQEIPAILLDNTKK